MPAAATASGPSAFAVVRTAVLSSLGAKVVMAVTGLLMFGWLVLHLLGNLAIFAGAESMNAYAHFLKSKPELLWPMRAALLAIAPLHIWAGLRLAYLARLARPEAYAARRWRKATRAARAMRITGLVALAFIVFHLLHFTGGVILGEFFPKAPADPIEHANVYAMVVNSFKIPWVVGVYVVGVGLVGLHLSHGIWSATQSLGLNGRKFTPFMTRASSLLAWGLIGLFLLIPIAVLVSFAAP
jgi:succinate dehydrogenase / fumarate reductase cytochrome b subunit